MLPLVTPVTVSFKCTLEAIGAYGSPYSSSTFCGASFIKPGGWVGGCHRMSSSSSSHACMPCCYHDAAFIKPGGWVDAVSYHNLGGS
jgi:hypothetical protein